jgi:3-hydroxyisobutyrate dehydrogenase-like beta-hydroxyacid dehydrogenase
MIMKIGLVGLGRMGKVLAEKWAGQVDLRLLDADRAHLAAVAAATGAVAVAGLADLAAMDAVVLAVPDREVVNCIKEMNRLQTPFTVINIATNVTSGILAEIAGAGITWISVKFVGHAREIAAGGIPVIIIDDRPAELIPLAEQLFAPVGQILFGRADDVAEVNTIAGRIALEAAVHLEQVLHDRGYGDSVIAKGAIRQVAAGILKAYADDDLGPFAREIVKAVREKMQRNV